jgi:hypothetical protein
VVGVCAHDLDERAPQTEPAELGSAGLDISHDVPSERYAVIAKVTVTSYLLNYKQSGLFVAFFQVFFHGSLRWVDYCRRR